MYESGCGLNTITKKAKVPENNVSAVKSNKDSERECRRKISSVFNFKYRTFAP